MTVRPAKKVILAGGAAVALLGVGVGGAVVLNSSGPASSSTPWTVLPEWDRANGRYQSAGHEPALVRYPADPTGAASTCTQYERIPVAGGAYSVVNNNYGAGVQECVSTDGNADFTVTSSTAAASAPGAPVSYPEIFDGCHWNSCTTGGALPLQVQNIGQATSSWSTTQVDSGNYDVAYDLWFNTTPATPAANGQPDGAELMVWLNQRSTADSPAGTDAVIGGAPYRAWQTTISANGRSWPLLGYRMNTPTTSVQNLDLRAFIRDAVVRGVVKPDWYLISVEAGFEIWSGGTGLQTNSFSSGQTPGYPVGLVNSGVAGLCLDNLGDQSTDGNPVALWNCDSQDAAQGWTVAIDGTIRHAGLCLGTTGNQVSLDTCNGSPYQTWEPGMAGALWNQGSGECLHNPSGSTIGRQIDLAPCDGGSDQYWTLPTTVSPAPS